MNPSPQATVTVYGPDQQARGAFDGGRITEIKPIAFPHESGAVDRVGPLFYWAWATSKGQGVIGMHPHQAFEIVSYVIEGELGHLDTLGTKSQVPAGGAQAMQTGSGVSHEEHMLAAPTQFFQVWFEPDVRQTIRDEPVYIEVQPDRFDVAQDNGVAVKRLIGPGTPIELKTDVTMIDVTIAPGGDYGKAVAAGRSLSVVTIDGRGRWWSGEAVGPRDFTLVEAPDDAEAGVAITADAAGPLRLAIVETPRRVDYPLYDKNR